MLKEYGKYKISNSYFGIKIPYEWDESKILHLFNIVSDKNHGNEELLSVYLNKGVVKYSSTSQMQVHKPSEDLSNYQLVKPGDFVLNNQQAWRGSVGVSKFRGIISPAYYILRPRKDINSDFLNYIVRDCTIVNQFVVASKGVGSIQRQIYLPYLKNIMIPIPQRPEQDKIVQFLDWKISEMNHFIHQKKKQIKLLEALKRNIIDDLITNGKNSEKRVKISKAKWMGNVPYDWNEYRLKNLFQEINVRSELGLEPHLSMSQKKGLVTDDEDIERRLLSESYAGAKLCEKDDLVLNRLKAHLGVFALAPMKGIVSPDYTVLRINAKRVIPKYLEYLLKSNACRRELVTRVRGIVEGFWRLYTEDLGEIPVCIPNIEEQKAILEVILEKTNNIDEMISGINKEITLVEELRTKLISDVVTGQIDVRDVKIPIYEVETDIIDFEDDTDEENLDESIEE